MKSAQVAEVAAEIEAQILEVSEWTNVVNHPSYAGTIQAWADEQLANAISERMNPNTPDKESLIAVGRGQAWSEVSNWARIKSQQLAELVELSKQGGEQPEQDDVGHKAEDQWFEHRD